MSRSTGSELRAFVRDHRRTIAAWHAGILVAFLGSVVLYGVDNIAEASHSAFRAVRGDERIFESWRGPYAGAPDGPVEPEDCASTPWIAVFPTWRENLALVTAYGALLALTAGAARWAPGLGFAARAAWLFFPTLFLAAVSSGLLIATAMTILEFAGAFEDFDARSLEIPLVAATSGWLEKELDLGARVNFAWAYLLWIGSGLGIWLAAFACGTRGGGREMILRGSAVLMLWSLVLWFFALAVDIAARNLEPVVSVSGSFVALLVAPPSFLWAAGLVVHRTRIRGDGAP